MNIAESSGQKAVSSLKKEKAEKIIKDGEHAGVVHSP